MKTRERIIQASWELFNKHGERNITTNHIAAHLNISPGNLYYHFRNKEEIIRSIFDLYEQQLQEHFQPYIAEVVDAELFISYFDALFDTLWEYRFMYNNLADILSRDESLKTNFQLSQKHWAHQLRQHYIQLQQDGVLIIEEDDVSPLVDTVIMVANFWISYKFTQSSSPIGSISKGSLYEGILRVLLLMQQYAAPGAEDIFKKTIEYYHSHEMSNKLSLEDPVIIK